MSVELDKDALALLTPEERAAVEDTEYSAEELAAMQGVAGDDDEESDDKNDGGEGAEASTGDDADGAAAEDDGKKAESVTDAAQADTGQAAEEVSAEPAAEFNPRYQAKLPEDFDASVTALKEETRALAEKFKSGEMEFDDYSTQLEALQARRDDLSELRVKASIAADMNTQTAEQQWQFTIDRFTKAVARDEKIDYSKDLEKQADLDTFVKALAGNVANADKSMDWFLTEAHRRVKALHGIAEPVAEEKKPEKPDRKPPIASVPKTLAQVPGSDGPGDVSGEFANVDALEGMDIEAAIAKMTPAQRERYLQGA
jgi:hypothetical protein